MKRIYSIDLLKAFACLLILNFHFEILFPQNISFLSIGADIGNNLFFMISGFLLYKKIANLEYKDFSAYYHHKMKKILPVLIMFYAILLATKTITIVSFKDFFDNFVFPSYFWFANAIIIFYFVIFYQTKLFSKKINIAISIIMLILHIIFDGILAECYIIGYVSMLYGYYLFEYLSSTKKKDVFILLILLILYIVLKLLRRNIFMFSRTIHLLVGIVIVALCSEMIKLMYKKEENLKYFFTNHKFINKTISAISVSTLEVYLINVYNNLEVIRIFKKFFVFPFSYVLCMICIIFVSYILHKTISYAIK